MEIMKSIFITLITLLSLNSLALDCPILLETENLSDRSFIIEASYVPGPGVCSESEIECFPALDILKITWNCLRILGFCQAIQSLYRIIRTWSWVLKDLALGRSIKLGVY